MRVNNYDRAGHWNYSRADWIPGLARLRKLSGDLSVGAWRSQGTDPVFSTSQPKSTKSKYSRKQTKSHIPNRINISDAAHPLPQLS